MLLYETEVIEIGSEVELFTESGILVTFGGQAPEEFRDFCYSIHRNTVQGDIKAGNKLLIDGQKFEIMKVGEVAQENLQSLGHVTYSFHGEEECLPGGICLKKAEIPNLKIGSKIMIEE